jgi:putative transposase
MLPSEFPPKSTVYDYFKKWEDGGMLDEISRVLRENVRVKAGRNKIPSASIIDSQTVKTTSISESKGYDGGKKIKGTKRHIAVDVLGLILFVIVHSAGAQERQGGKWLIAKLLNAFPTIKKIWADGGYSGNSMVEWVKGLAKCVFEVVTRPRKKFQIVKWRWIVERTFGWFNCYRRLSKDYEYYHKSSEAWIKLASINIMVHRLSPG